MVFRISFIFPHILCQLLSSSEEQKRKIREKRKKKNILFENMRYHETEIIFMALIMRIYIFILFNGHGCAKQEKSDDEEKTTL